MMAAGYFGVIAEPVAQIVAVVLLEATEPADSSMLNEAGMR